MATKRISLSLLLPVLELSAWTMLVPTEVGLIYYGAHRATHGASAPLGSAELILPPDRWVEYALRWMPLRDSHTIIAANLPGFLPDLLISLPTDQPGKWHPSWASLENWRCFTFPYYCLPAWWFVGYGLDALLARRRVRRAALRTGTILSLLFAAALSPGRVERRSSRKVARSVRRMAIPRLPSTEEGCVPARIIALLGGRGLGSELVGRPPAVLPRRASGLQPHTVPICQQPGSLHTCDDRASAGMRARVPALV